VPAAPRLLAPVPVLVVEVLSPSTRRRDFNQKRQFYLDVGVEEYWIVDPLAQTLDVYRQEDGTLFHLTHLTRENTLTSSLLPGFRCPVADLFSRL